MRTNLSVRVTLSLLCTALLASACHRPPAVRAPKPVRAKQPVKAPRSAPAASQVDETSGLGRFSVVPTAELAATVSEAPVRAAGPVELLEPSSECSALVDRAVANAVPALRSCYERAAHAEPAPAGKMKVSITVEPSGLVGQVRTLENTTGSERIARCIVPRLRRIQVEPDPEGRIFSCVYPLVFHANASGR